LANELEILGRGKVISRSNQIYRTSFQGKVISKRGGGTKKQIYRNMRAIVIMVLKGARELFLKNQNCLNVLSVY